MPKSYRSIPPFPWDRLLVKSVSGTWHIAKELDGDGQAEFHEKGWWPEHSRTECSLLVKPMGFTDPVVPEDATKICCNCSWWNDYRTSPRDFPRHYSK